MAGEFEVLVQIIGVVKALKVIAELGGRTIKIRKKLGSVREKYARQRLYYDGLEADVAAKLLGCTPRYVVMLRAWADSQDLGILE